MHSTLSKAELRIVLRQRRRAIPERLRTQAAASVALHATQIPDWPEARHIALYLAADGEVETSHLQQLTLGCSASIYLPTVSGEGVMQFRLWESGTELVTNRYGIPEPGPDSLQCPLETLDIVFLPLVGWSENGARLGMGGGYYDRALSGSTKPLLVGLGFDCQKVTELPTEDWDIPLDFVATESALHDCRANN